MSFILDALKKSEAERQRQNTPGIADVPDARERKSPRKWVRLAVVLLGINLAALLGVLYMANRGTEPAATLAPVMSGNTEQTSASFSDIVAEAKRTQPERSEAATTAATTQLTAPAATVALPMSAISESYATFNNLRAQGILSLPDLHLDIHVYSGQPAERFVFINMKKYKESSKLGEGPVVKQITPDGVVLGYQGTDFLLPRE